MRDCIFTAHCMESICDKSCPTFVEVNYLLERNRLIDDVDIYKLPQKDIDKLSDILDKYEGRLGVYVVPSGSTSNKSANALTYCAICKNWRGNQLHLAVYNLRYSTYLENLKKSWNRANYVDSDDLEYLDIWIKSCKVLIISNFDFVNFGDFESQTLLTLIQDRQYRGLTTILVTPPINTLVSTKTSIFFDTLKSMMRTAIKEVTR